MAKKDDKDLVGTIPEIPPPVTPLESDKGSIFGKSDIKPPAKSKEEEKADAGKKALQGAQSAAKKEHDKVEVRHEGDSLIYSVGDVDMISRSVNKPDEYTVLHDFPKFGYHIGEVKTLTDASDEQCACTARDLANSLK